MSRRGSNAVEFALVLPLLLILASGVIDVGQYLVTADALTAAIADGAREGALTDPDDASPNAMAEYVADRNYTAAGMAAPLDVVAVTSGTDPDRALTVTGTVTVTPLFGFLSLPSTIDHSVTVRLVHQ